MADVPEFIRKLLESGNVQVMRMSQLKDAAEEASDTALDRLIADVREAAGPSGDLDTLDPIKLTMLMDKLDELRRAPAPEPRKEVGDVPTFSSSVGALRIALKFSQLAGGPGEEDDFFRLARRVHAFITTTEHKDGD
jgi:hypothetical protein